MKRKQLISEYAQAIKTMRSLLRDMPEASHEKIKSGLLVGQNALGKTALSLGLNAPETALLLEFLLESWRDWRRRRETKLLNDLERDWIEPIGPEEKP